MLAAGCVTVGLLLVYALLASYVYLEPSLPTADNLKGTSLSVPLRVYARGGELIAQIGEQRRVPVSYEDIPQLVREAFVSAEDARFFQHHGFDYSGVLRAAFVDLTSGDFTQGASTITMQAARNMFLTFDKTIRRKLQEIFLTYRMEHEFSKEQILTTYLNVIFLGQRSYGVAAAAETYFGKSLAQLSVAEAATLAGIPQAPSLYNPITGPRRALARRHYVLSQMARLRYIDDATERRADSEPLSAREHAPLVDVEAPYVAEMARAELVSRFGEDAVNQGYKVYTTIDGRLQTAADRALRLGLIEYDRRHGGYRGPLRQLQSDPAAPARLDAALANVPEMGELRAAVVVSVAPMTARVYVRTLGYAQIDWDGLSWARRKLSDTRLGPAPRRAEDVVQRGDVVYVVTDGRGGAQLAQIPEAQGALVALDPNDGSVISLVGGFDYFQNKFNRATQARRQPGSGFKPFLYSAALEHGFTPASVVMDAPIVFDDQEKSYRPKNSENEFEGPTRLREALVHSRNLVTIRVVRQMGIDYAIDYTSKFGFDPADIPHDFTLALGTLVATPLQVATAYAAFANGGYRIASYFIDRIENGNGEVVWSAAPLIACELCEAVPTQAAPEATAAPDPAAPSVAPPNGTAADAAATGTPPAPSVAAASEPPAAPDTAAPPAGDPSTYAGSQHLPPLIAAARRAPRIISPDNAWLMDDMMADVIKRGTGIRARVLGRNDIAGKTGTTNEATNTWFNGFNRNVVASVWVGYDQERPLGEGEEGSRTAVPIWTSFMREALRDTPDVPRPLPSGLVTLRVDKRTGLLAGNDDADAMYETFMQDRVPTQLGPSMPTPGQGAQGAAGGEPLF
jgi:penicillin-binding protein 1A